LALALGMSVGQLEKNMSGREVAEWQAFYRLEPFGDFRGDLRAGTIACTIANVFSGKGEKRSPFDFMFFNKNKQKVSRSISDQVSEVFDMFKKE
jgi:hypothetical protein